MIRRLLLIGFLAIVVTGCGSRPAPPAPAPDPVAELLARQGWKSSGPRVEGTARLPADFKLRSGFPWQIVVDFSHDVDLNLEPYAGQDVRHVSMPVADVRGGRLEGLKSNHNFRAQILLDRQSDRPVGAWVSPTRQDGELEVGGPGYSLTSRDLNEITGISFFEYVQKYRATPPSHERLAAERPRNAIHDYFRAAAAQDCAKVWALLTQQVKAQTTEQAICDSYAPFASLRVIEVADEVSDQYEVILEVKHKPGQRSPWPEGITRLRIPLVQEA